MRASSGRKANWAIRRGGRGLWVVGEVTPARRLKVEFHRELQDSWVLRAGDIAESARGAQRQRRIVESHVVQHIERFGTELEVFALPDAELSYQSGIELEEFRAEHV